MDYAEFFKVCTGFDPLPYQVRLELEWDRASQLEIPTGLGKTAAVLIPFLWRHARAEPAPTRLAYCLPVRTLVSQAAREARRFVDNSRQLFEDEGRPLPRVNVLMGGARDTDWVSDPFTPAVVVGTQDQLLSRALNRGYTCSRFQWPIHFAWLHDDTRWIYDEMQLMGVAVETGAQLEGLRRKLGVWNPSSSLWMSATMEAERIATIDRPPREDEVIVTLARDDHEHPVVAKRQGAKKSLLKLDHTPLHKTLKGQASSLAEAVLSCHVPGELTLVVMNRVARAQGLYAAIQAQRGDMKTTLIHSRFRPCDRAGHLADLHTQGDHVVVATQAIEAGVDVSARVLITELAPWSSLVQRCGRCNRRGEFEEAQVHWVDLEEGKGASGALPYGQEELKEARGILDALHGDIGLEAIAQVEHSPPARIRPVLRRRDLMALFDTQPDLSGGDVDVSRFIRDDQDRDVQLFWRDFEGSPDRSLPAPEPGELCRVSISAATAWYKKLTKSKDDKPASLWRWDFIEGSWRRAYERDLRPGAVLLVHAMEGGYDVARGWLGRASKARVPPLPLSSAQHEEGMGRDPGTSQREWVEIKDHLDHVHAEAVGIVHTAKLGKPWSACLEEAAREHDTGKAHPVFQEMLCSSAAHPPPRSGVVWAKSSHRQGRKPRGRRFFRHELASLLIWEGGRGARDDLLRRERDLTGYLIGSHHGKLRVCVRSLPDEPPGQIMGVRTGDRVGDPLDASREHELSLDLFTLGSGSWAARVHSLLHDAELGPFRLATLEAMLRLADVRASRKESEGGQA